MIQTSENIRVSFLQNIDNNNLYLSDAVLIIDEMFKILNPKTISNYAKDNNISYNGVKKRIKAGKVMSIKIDNVIFVI